MGCKFRFQVTGMGGRCLYEMAVRYDEGKETCFLTSNDIQLGGALTTDGSFFDGMRVTVAADRRQIQDQIIATYRTQERFDVTMKMVFRSAGGRIV